VTFNPCASYSHVAVLVGGAILLADSDLLALADSVSNFNHLRSQEVGLPLSLARVFLEKVRVQFTAT
jgi:hypothetical protein